MCVCLCVLAATINASFTHTHTHTHTHTLDLVFSTPGKVIGATMLRDKPWYDGKIAFRVCSKVKWLVG